MRTFVALIITGFSLGGCRSDIPLQDSVGSSESQLVTDAGPVHLADAGAVWVLMHHRDASTSLPEASTIVHAEAGAKASLSSNSMDIHDAAGDATNDQ